MIHITLQNKKILALIVILLVISAALILILNASAHPCARVKAGTVAFMDSKSCIKECAVDGGDCPYNAHAINKGDTP